MEMVKPHKEIERERDREQCGKFVFSESPLRSRNSQRLDNTDASETSPRGWMGKWALEINGE